MGYHITGLSSPSPVRHITSHLVPPRSLSLHPIYCGRSLERLWKSVKSKKKISAFSLQFIQRFINSSWYDRHEEPPSPQTITMIWSLIVSMYAVGGLFGAISIKFVSGMLGRWVRETFSPTVQRSSRWRRSFIRKKAVICNSLVAVVAAGIMLTSKGAKSYEMIIVARSLFGYSAGELYSVTTIANIMFLSAWSTSCHDLQVWGKAHI